MRNFKWGTSILTLLFIFSVWNVNSTEASGGISIYVNGEKQSYSNQAIIKEGRTLVPMRGIFETLGASVQWNQDDKTVKAEKGSTKIWLKIGSKTTKVNEKTITISVPAQVKNGHTLVPIRFISESLGESIRWDQGTKTVSIGKETDNSFEKRIQHFLNQYSSAWEEHDFGKVYDMWENAADDDSIEEYKSNRKDFINEMKKQMAADVKMEVSMNLVEIVDESASRHGDAYIKSLVKVKQRVSKDGEVLEGYEGLAHIYVMEFNSKYGFLIDDDFDYLEGDYNKLDE
jgi:hypothetical protein